MRIIVFGHPRSCSTYVQDLLSQKLNLQNWGEMVGPNVFKYGSSSTRFEINESDLISYDDYVTKLLTFHLYSKTFKLDKIDWSRIDKVYVTERKNLTDQICSLFYMKRKQVIDVKSTEFSNMLRCLKIFYEAKQFLTRNANTVVLPYELFQQPSHEYVEELNRLTNLKFEITDCVSIHKKEYSTLIENYNEVEEIVNNFLVNEGLLL